MVYIGIKIDDFNGICIALIAKGMSQCFAVSIISYTDE
jgi:hypothetical protein